MHGAPSNAARLAAERYIAEGWKIVPVPAGEKSPIEPGWPDVDWPAERIDGNVGVILGSVSNHLCDVDLDAHWALPLAPYFLPPTATFGRKSKPRSHWLYYCEGLRCQQFKFEREGKIELVELRGMNASNDRCGHQSVFPGSVHKSGETVEWDPEGLDAITTVQRGPLIWATTRLAVACVIAEGWLPGSQRNNKARAWAAGLLTMGWVPNEVYELFDAVFEVAGVERSQRDNDLAGVQRTIDAFERGDKLQGFGTLVAEGLVEQKTVRRIETLARTPSTLAAEAKLAQSKTGADLKERFTREAHDLDALGARQELATSDSSVSTSSSESFFGGFVDLRAPAPDVEYICKGLSIAPGNKITLLAGFGGTSKGPTANYLALCIATGRPFLGHPCKKRKVAFFDFETGRILLAKRFWRLSNALGIDREELAQNMDLIVSKRRIDAEWLKMFEESAEPGTVCFIDSYTSATSGDKNKSEYADNAWALGRIAESKDLTIIVTMHARKKQKGFGEDLLESVQGTSDLTSAAQSAIIISRPKAETPNVISLKCGRALEEPFKPFEIEWSDVAEPGAPMSTPGEQAANGKWGLLAKRIDSEMQEKRDEKKKVATQAELEVDIMKHMHTHYPDGIKAEVRAIVQRAANPMRDAHRSAVRQLVKRGTLNANFHWKSEVRAKQMVWLPGSNAESGEVQN